MDARKEKDFEKESKKIKNHLQGIKISWQSKLQEGDELVSKPISASEVNSCLQAAQKALPAIQDAIIARPVQNDPTKYTIVVQLNKTTELLKKKEAELEKVASFLNEVHPPMGKKSWYVKSQGFSPYIATPGGEAQTHQSPKEIEMLEKKNFAYIDRYLIAVQQVWSDDARKFGFNDDVIKKFNEHCQYYVDQFHQRIFCIKDSGFLNDLTKMAERYSQRQNEYVRIIPKGSTATIISGAGIPIGAFKTEKKDEKQQEEKETPSQNQRRILKRQAGQIFDLNEKPQEKNISKEQKEPPRFKH